MGKRLRTDASEPKDGRPSKDVEQPPLPPIKAWHPSRLKTGLRNHSIGRKVPINSGPSA
jgi:hypothetical protein